MYNYADWFTPLPLLPLKQHMPAFRYPTLPKNDTGFGDRVRTTTTLVPTVTKLKSPNATYYEKYDAWTVIQSKIHRNSP